MEPTTTAALIGGGASILGGVMGGNRAKDAARAAGEYGLRIDGENRKWQDVNYHRTLGAQFGSDYKNVDNQSVIYEGKGSDLLGRDRDLEYSGKHIDQSFNKLSERGLTPQEIAGSPVPGGAKVSGGNNTLGNAVSSASQSRSNARTALSAQLIDSKTKLEATKMQTQAHLQGEMIKAGVNIAGQQTASKTSMYVSDIASKTGRYNATQVSNAQIEASKIHAEASKYGSDTSRKNVLSQLKVKKQLTDTQVAKISAEIALIKQDKNIKEVLHDERFQRLFATMGPDNVLASVLAVKNGIDIKSVLQGLPIKDQASILNFTQQVAATKSTVKREAMGLSTSLTEYMQRLVKSVQNVIDWGNKPADGWTSKRVNE